MNVFLKVLHTIYYRIYIALRCSAQSRRAQHRLLRSPRGAKNEVLSSDGLTSLIKIYRAFDYAEH